MAMTKQTPLQIQEPTAKEKQEIKEWSRRGASAINIARMYVHFTLNEILNITKNI